MAKKRNISTQGGNKEENDNEDEDKDEWDPPTGSGNFGVGGHKDIYNFGAKGSFNAEVKELLAELAMKIEALQTSKNEQSMEIEAQSMKIEAQSMKIEDLRLEDARVNNRFNGILVAFQPQTKYALFETAIYMSLEIAGENNSNKKYSASQGGNIFMLFVLGKESFSSLEILKNVAKKDLLPLLYGVLAYIEVIGIEALEEWPLKEARNPLAHDGAFLNAMNSSSRKHKPKYNEEEIMDIRAKVTTLLEEYNGNDSTMTPLDVVARIQDAYNARIKESKPGQLRVHSVC